MSSYACFNLVALPCLHKLMGWQKPELRRVHVELAEPTTMDPQRPEYARATVHWKRYPQSKFLVFEML